MRAAVRTVLVTALAVGLLWVFVRNADLDRVWIEMRAARAEWLALSVLLTVATYLVRAERWQYLLEPLGPTRFWVAFRATVIGFAAIFLLPARAGEVLRPYLLAKHEGLPVTAAFATVVIERILDLTVVLMLLGAYLAIFGATAAAAAPALYRTVAIGGLVMAPVALGIFAAMVVMAGHPERLHALVLGIERVLPQRIARLVAGFAKTFAEGLAVVRRPARLFIALAWTFALWVLIATQAWVVAHAFGIAMPFPGSFLLTAMLVVGVSVPTPGGIGGIHEAFRLGVTAFFGADNDVAVGAAIVHHAVGFILVTIMGVWCAMRDGLTFGNLKSLSREVKP